MKLAKVKNTMGRKTYFPIITSNGAIISVSLENNKWYEVISEDEVTFELQPEDYENTARLMKYKFKVKTEKDIHNENFHNKMDKLLK